MKISPGAAINGFVCRPSPRKENHDAGLGPQLAKLWDVYPEVRRLDSRANGETARHLIRIDAFGEPITWEVLTSGSSV